MKSKKLDHLLPFCLSLSLIIGIVIGYHFPWFWIFLTMALLSFSLIVIFYKKNNFFLSDVFITLFFIFLGALWVIPSIKQDINSFSRKEAQFQLKVISLPQEGANRNIFYAKIKKINNVLFNKKIKVMDYTYGMEYLYSYQAQGKISKRKYAGRDFYTLWVKKDAEVKELPIPFRDRFARKTTDHFLSVFKNNLTEQGYRFMASVFLGRREVLGEEKQMLTNAGVAHLLALSGLHLGLISLIVFFILRLFYLPFRKCLIISLLFLLLYTFLTGMAWSTLRAALMYSFLAAGFFMKRRVNLLNSLGLAGLCTLLMNPLALFEVGFQLSYVAVFALIVWFKIFPVKALLNRFLNYAQSLFFCSLCVTIFLTPLISQYFGRIYILSVFYNLVLIPFFALLLTTGFLLIIFSALGFIAQSIGGILSLGIAGFVSLSRLFGSFRLSYFEYRFSSYMVWGYYFLLAAVLISIRWYMKTKRMAVECPVES